MKTVVFLSFKCFFKTLENPGGKIWGRRNSCRFEQLKNKALSENYPTNFYNIEGKHNFIKVPMSGVPILHFTVVYSITTV